ncbi:MAG: AAA family ATPase, partial [Eggerthellaceae bacterium]|nr:AAA family ATPase [Eggerthellaceae bacterium]
MGMHLNPGNGLFQMSLNSEIYVDKSGLIAYTNHVLNTQQRFVCVSRPRRFGKSMAADMLAAYYGRGADSRGQFAGLAIAGDPSFEEHLNRYDVIQLNMQNFLADSDGVDDMLDYVAETVIKELTRAYPGFEAPRRGGLPRALSEAHAETGVPLVFIIDEWDCVFRIHRDDRDGQTRYLDWLRNLLKDRVYVALAYMTGILPIKKYGQHSALNMFSEISITDAAPLEESTGFTQAEVDELCKRYSVPVDEMRRWYDGYLVGGLHVYNPRSVVQSLTRKSFGNYWTQTETFEALRVYIDMNMDGLRDAVVRLVAGEPVAVDTTTFVNDMVTFAGRDDVLTLLVHLGYLTYDFEAKRVSVPIHEVMEQFKSTLLLGGWEEVAASIRRSDDLVAATLSRDAGKVAELVARTHQE